MPNGENLRRAARTGDHARVRQLLDEGADVNDGSTHGTTALHLASLNSHSTCVQLLLQSGADVNIVCDNDITVLICAVQDSHDTCSRQPWNTAADVKSADGSKEPQITGRAACVDMLLKSGAGVNTALADGMTPLMRATIMKCDICVALLLEAGADVGGSCYRLYVVTLWDVNL